MATIKLVNSLNEEQVKFMTQILGEIGDTLETAGIKFKIRQNHPSVGNSSDDIMNMDLVETVFEIDETSWSQYQNHNAFPKAA